MITPELITFIKQQLSAGVSREQISQTLQKNGWTSADIGEAFTQAMPPAPIVPPAPTVPPIVQNNYQPTMPTTNPANQYRPVAQQPIIQPIIIQPNVAQPNMNQPVQMQPVMSAQGNTKWMVWAIILIVLAGIGYAGWVFKDQITALVTQTPAPGSVLEEENLSANNKFNGADDSVFALLGLHTKPATNITKNSAVLNANIYGQLSGTPCNKRTIYFEYGTSPTELLPTEAQPVITPGTCEDNTPAFAEPADYSITVNGLESNTTYYFKAVLTFDGVKGEDSSISNFATN